MELSKARFSSTTDSQTAQKRGSIRRPISILWMAVMVLCSAIGGGHIGYYMGIHASKQVQQQTQHTVIQNTHQATKCICNETIFTTTCNDVVVKQQEPCPNVTVMNTTTCDGAKNEEHKLNNASSSSTNANEYEYKPRFPVPIERLAVGMSRISRDEFAKTFDTGVPLEKTEQGNEQVLILYSHVDALPISHEEAQSQGDIPLISVDNATANCDFLNVILTNVDFHKKQCVALMGQAESSHIQRWMRLPPKGSEVNSTEPLRFVGRVSEERFGEDFESENAPPSSDTQNHWEFLRTYTADLQSMLQELRPLAEKVAINNTIIVMFSNFGQSELIINFGCSARNRNLNLSQVLFFATDLPTKELVESLGMTGFYNEALFGRLPSFAAQHYMDRTFIHMMKAKVICLHLASLLGHDILFQDADVIWYRDPIPYFHNGELATFDVLIADDGNAISKYLPYQGNGGVFYVRHNRKTMYLLNALLLLSDSVNGGNEQYLINQLLAEFASLYGMKVKSLSREDFPTGVVFHNEMNMMKGILDGSIRPYLFHMSWTMSKVDKVLYLEQMGEWYVKDQCIGKDGNAPVLMAKRNSSSQQQQPDSLLSFCCAVKPLVSCHFLDKPSLIECKNSTQMSPKEGMTKDDVESFW